MKTLYKVALVLALISSGYAISAWENQEFVKLSSDIHSLAYIPNIVADSRTAGAETRPSVYTVKLDYINRFPFGDPGFHETPDYSVAGYKTTSVETRPSVYTVKLDNMNSFPLGDPDLGFWTAADFTVADSRTAGALTRPSVYTVKLDNMNSFPLGDPDLGFWTDADFTVADSRTEDAGELSSNYLGESLALRTDIADHRVSSVVDFRTSSAEKRSTRLMVDGSYFIPNIEGP